MKLTFWWSDMNNEQDGWVDDELGGSFMCYREN